MDDQEWLAERFEEHRAHLRAVAHRMLGAPNEAIDPEPQALMADSIGLALLVVLETLTPAERVAFVLHDMFALPSDDVAPIVGRSPAAARQLASRARRRVHGSRAIPDTDLSEQRALVEAFLAASRGGQFETLVTMLDPKVVLRADPAAAQMGAPSEAHGAQAVAETFAGRARVAKVALLGGTIGAV
jgi:hypothetical protein